MIEFLQRFYQFLKTGVKTWYNFMYRVIDRILIADGQASSHITGLNLSRELCIWIEWMIHGFPWLVTSFLLLIASYGRNWSEKAQYGFMVLILGLLFDIIFVGIIKGTFQRRRPVNPQDHLLEYTFDIFSFPSGHTSRAFMLATFLHHFSPPSFYLLCWIPLVVAFSRVALGRHFITDVVAGVVIGIVEGKLFLLLPLSLNTWFKEVLK